MKTIHGTHSDGQPFTLYVAEEGELGAVIQDGIVTEVGITFEVDLDAPPPHRTTMTKAEYEAFMDELRRTGLVWRSTD
jgi:hypothetical protein